MNLNPIPTDASPEDVDRGQHLRSLADAVKRVGCDGTEADKAKLQALFESNMAISVSAFD